MNLPVGSPLEKAACWWWVILAEGKGGFQNNAAHGGNIWYKCMVWKCVYCEYTGVLETEKRNSQGRVKLSLVKLDGMATHFVWGRCIGVGF